MLDFGRTFKVTLVSLQNFAYVSRYLDLKSFAWIQDCPISSKVPLQKLINIILESSYRVLQVISKWKALKQPIYFLKIVELWPTFDIRIDIVLAIFWKKLQNYTF